MRQYLPETILSYYAGIVAEYITVRTYDDGTSIDTRREATQAEKSVLRNVAKGTLLGLNYGEPVRKSKDAAQAIFDTAEFVLMQFIPDANTYDSIYLPVKAFTEAWRAASDYTTTIYTSWAARVMWNLFPEWHDFFSGLMAYAQDDEYLPLRTLDDAETQIEGWAAWCDPDDRPSFDSIPAEALPALVFILWNLYLIETEPEKVAAAVGRWYA